MISCLGKQNIGQVLELKNFMLNSAFVIETDEIYFDSFIYILKCEAMFSKEEEFFEYIRFWYKL